MCDYSLVLSNSIVADACRIVNDFSTNIRQRILHCQGGQERTMWLETCLEKVNKLNRGALFSMERRIS